MIAPLRPPTTALLLATLLVPSTAGARPVALQSLPNLDRPPSVAQAGTAPAATPGEILQRLAAALPRAAGTPAVAPPRPDIAPRGRPRGPAAAATGLAARADLSVRRDPRDGTPRLIHGMRLETTTGSGVVTAARAEATARRFLARNRALLRLPATSMPLARVRRDRLGYSQHRFVPTHDGVPMWPAEVLVQTDPEGAVDLYVSDRPRIDRRLVTTPTLDADAARAAWRATRQGGVVTGVPELVIYTRRATPRLAWKFVGHAPGPGPETAVVDAHTGRILDLLPRRVHVAAAGSGVDLHGAVRPLGLDLDAGIYTLHDTAPAGGTEIEVRTATGQVADNQLNLDRLAGDFFAWTEPVTSAQPDAGWPATAVSAYATLLAAADYFTTVHGHDSFDGAGMPITACTEVGSNYNNAFYARLGDFEVVCFGQRDDPSGHLLKALDVAAHEYTHGVTEHLVELVYHDQSGAISEALSDIFAELVERHASGVNDWRIGTGSGRVLRDFAVPTNGDCRDGVDAAPVPCPARLGDYLHTPFDHAGVHTNSSIINHAFWLLAEGLPGAIGADAAGATWFRALGKLTRGADFHALRAAVDIAAQELFGAGAETAAVTAAFDAVQIYADNNADADFADYAPVSGADATLFVYFDVGSGDYRLGRRETDMEDPAEGVLLPTLGGVLQGTRPVVTANGEWVFFVRDDLDLCFVPTTQKAGDPPETCLLGSLQVAGEVHGLAISHDGRFWATAFAQPGQPPREIYIYDDLFGIVTGPARLGIQQFNELTTRPSFVDSMDFTYYGGTLVFDAFSEVTFADGSVQGLWGLHFLDVNTLLDAWYNHGVLIAETRPLTQPQPGVTIGNFVFANTSDRYAAFTTHDEATDRAELVAINLSTGNPVTIDERDGEWLYRPSFAGDDHALVFDIPAAASATGAALVRMPLADDHVTPTQAEPDPWLDDATAPFLYRRGNYVPPEVVKLTVTRDGTADGFVYAALWGIECGSNCDGFYVQGTALRLSAVPVEHAVFAGWSDPGCGAAPDCVVTLDSDIAITATFVFPDGDADTVFDHLDNCPATANVDQADLDRDGAGNACDDDDDGDGLADADEPGHGTSSLDPDSDGDGLDDGAEVALGTDPIHGDSDGDTLLDGAEIAGGLDPLAVDSDGDTRRDDADNCPRVANLGQEDADGNGRGDACELTLDVDGDGRQVLLGDGLLLLRALRGLAGPALTAGTVGAGAAPDRDAPGELRALVDGALPRFDVDGDAVPGSAADARLLLRWFAGFRGAALVDGIVPTGESDAVKARLEALEQLPGGE